MKMLRKIRDMIFGATTISVGHGAVKGDRSAVVLFVGRRYVALSPDGARKIADQLKLWADHADTMGRATHVMKWIVKLTRKPEENAAEGWIAAGLEKASEKLSGADCPQDNVGAGNG